MRSLTIFFFGLLLIACIDAPKPGTGSDADNTSVRANTSTEHPISFTEPAPMSEGPEYPGKTIDQLFPIISDHSFADGNFREMRFDVEVLGFRVAVSGFAPQSIKKNSKALLKYRTRQPADYWSNLVGVSSLLGPESKQIYVVSTGPGAVCCTNYWITDVSSKTPRNLFRSEDYGSFRNAMEVFDAEGDGVYELVQFDSCFRYFMDDCGSCSPEPRAYFRYDAKRQRYRPVKGVQQDFVKKEMERTEKWIEEKYQELKAKNDLTTEFDLHRTVLSYVADLLHIGEEKKAWRVFNKYGNDADGKVRKEIRRRLASCEFYQALIAKR